ncbi:T9SS type A sorting domain-containing protein [bacterium]|nr:T9SS type A sorting domain-containing protein [bacterium]
MNSRCLSVCRNLLTAFLLLAYAVLFAEPLLDVNRGALNFGACSYGQTGSQILSVNNAGDGTLNWSVSTEQSWLTVMPSSGSGSCQVTVTADPDDMTPDSYYSDLIITNTDNPADQAHISTFLNVYTGTEEPFGSFDTPLDGSAVSGSVPFTGWVLDDVRIKSVTVYMDESGSQTYIGQAVLVEGARPDVESLYPGYPMSYKAGWSYILQTHQLPDGGNGTYTFDATARDDEGNTVQLGTKTIICDNANAVKPFGAIDTPAPGGTAYGDLYRVSGWVLTPRPNKIPEDGLTIRAYVDGVLVDHATYNVYRQDIAALYPDYENANGAGAWFDLNTTAYENGLHTIQWTATDNAGNTDGIGSRYFCVFNQEDMPRPVLNRPRVNFGADLEGNHTASQYVRISNSGGGTLKWEVNPDDWSWWSVEPLSGENTEYVKVSVQPGGLEPIFYSGMTPIYIPEIGETSFEVALWKTDMSSDHYIPFGEFDTPQEGSTVSGSISVTGWALDEIGVESVKIYGCLEGGPNTYIGDAVFVEGARPDIANMKSGAPCGYKAGWGYILMTNMLPDGGQGTYTLDAVATNIAGKQVSLGTKTIQVDNANSVKPFGAIDSPGWGEVVSGSSVKISGWVLAPQPSTIPTDGSTISIYIDGKFIGHPTYNEYREDIAVMFPEYNNSQGAGWSLFMDISAFQDAPHSISWDIGTSDIGPSERDGGLEKSIAETATMTAQLFVVQNERPVQNSIPDTPQSSGPDQFTLYPVYPNPFNPVTKIEFHLNQAGRVELNILDMLGRHVKTLVSGQQKEAGKHETEWSGTDDSGMPLASGVYFLRLKCGKLIQSRKMILIR